MKAFKKTLFITALSSLLLSGSLSAQDIDMSQNVTVEGKAGKMIIFKAIPGLSNFALSRNGKFLIGRTDGDVTSDDAGGYIYEIATGKIKKINASVVEVVDWDNYVTTAYAIIGGKEYAQFRDLVSKTIGFAVEEASADLLTLRVGLYLTRQGADWSNILVETQTGKILDTLTDLDPNYPLGGKMTMGWCMSNDAKIVAGRSSLEGAAANYAPAFWDRDRDTVYFTGYTYKNADGEDYFTAGSMWGVNGTGTLLCGCIHEKACYTSYDRTTGKYDMKYIDIYPGYDQSQAYRINENGVIIGTEQMGNDIYTRRPYIYDTKKGQKYIMAEYLQDLYGLNSEQATPLFTPTGISDDGRLISGSTYDGPAWYSYLILLDEHQIYAPVRNVQVQNIPRRSSNVVVSWQEPLQGEYTLTGYNVFRDKQKINDQPIAANELSFTDANVANGKHRYFVQAVYGNNVSDALDTLAIFVVDPNGCLPVQEIYKDVEYNRTVSLFWGRPSDQETANIINRPKGSAPKYIPQEGLDFVSVFQPAASRMSAGIRIGDYIYTGSYESGNIYVYDVRGNNLKEISVDGLGSIYDMAYHDGSFYVATETERILQMDWDPDDPLNPDKFSISNQFTTTFSKAVSVTYVENDDPSINNGEDYLLVGDYFHLVGYPLGAEGPDDEFNLPVKFDIEDMIISGSEYYKGRLYLTDQNGTNGCDLVAYDMATGEKLFTTDLYTHPTVVEASYNINGDPEAVYSGGITHAVLDDGTVVLECLVQCSFTYNMLVDMELESSSDVLGYVVYRNNKPVSDTLKARHFTQIIDEAGTYTYHIEYLSVRGCSSSSKDMEVTCTVDIYEKGTCGAPAEFNVYESNEKAVLSWSAEKDLTDGFVGFNLYRNGEQIGEKHFWNSHYIDSEVELGTEYVYRLEAFYGNSCTASDSVKITLDGKGAAREPAAFKVKGTEKEDNSIDAKATWGMPYFEEPMAYGYCGVPAAGTYFDGTSQIFCIIGWKQEDMDKFDDDLYLVGVEYMLDNNDRNITTVNTVVYIDNKLVYNEPFEERFEARQWVRDYLGRVYKMKQTEEIAVGYLVSYNPAVIEESGAGIFMFDMGPRTQGKSDLISYDGVEYGTLYAMSNHVLDVNLCINALVVRLRDLEAAASAADPQEYLMSKTMRMDLKGQLGQEHKFTDAPKTSSEGIKFIGFNIYRNGKKLNDTLMKGLSYEENVAREDYEYEVGAVYEGAEEQKAYVFAQFTTLGTEELEQAYGVSVYPNPVTDRLNIKGDYASFMLVDMNGRVLMRDVRNTESVSLANLNEGVYFVLITLPNGDKRAVKVIKR